MWIFSVKSSSYLLFILSIRMFPRCTVSSFAIYSQGRLVKFDAILTLLNWFSCLNLQRLTSAMNTALSKILRRSLFLSWNDWIHNGQVSSKFVIMLPNTTFLLVSQNLTVFKFQTLASDWEHIWFHFDKTGNQNFSQRNIWIKMSPMRDWRQYILHSIRPRLWNLCEILNSDEIGFEPVGCWIYFFFNFFQFQMCWYVCDCAS